MHHTFLITYFEIQYLGILHFTETFCFINISDFCVFFDKIPEMYIHSAFIIHLAQERDQWQALVNAVMNLQVP